MAAKREISTLFRVSPPFASLQLRTPLYLFLSFFSVSRSFLGSIHSCSRNSKFPLLATQKPDGRSSLNFTKLPFSQVPFEISAFSSRICGISLALHRRQMQFFPSFLFFFFSSASSSSLPPRCRVTHPQPSEWLRLGNRSSSTFVSVLLSLFSATFLIGGSFSAYR